jgi:hypothetical protein
MKVTEIKFTRKSVFNPLKVSHPSKYEKVAKNILMLTPCKKWDEDVDALLVEWDTKKQAEYFRNILMSGKIRCFTTLREALKESGSRLSCHLFTNDARKFIVVVFVLNVGR